MDIVGEPIEALAARRPVNVHAAIRIFDPTLVVRINVGKIRNQVVVAAVRCYGPPCRGQLSGAVDDVVVFGIQNVAISILRG